MSAIAMPIDTAASWSFRRLCNNGNTVKNLRDLIAAGLSRIETIPLLVRAVIREEAWKRWRLGEEEHSAREFRQFLTAKWPYGCEADLAVLEKALRGTDVWEDYKDALADEPGNPGERDPRTGRFKPSDPITDNIRNWDVPHIVPIPRDRSNDMPGGTSSIAAIRRLSRERPELLDRVKAGELTPNAAMVEAGFRDRTITVPSDPEGAARRLRRHFDGDRLQQLIDFLAR